MINTGDQPGRVRPVARRLRGPRCNRRHRDHGPVSSAQIKDLERQTEQLRRASEARDALSLRASTDPLTEVANRRAFWERSSQLLRRAEGPDRSVLVYIDLDDFGTGFSSMTPLQTLPIHGLKIDRSFVGRVLESERDREPVAATISMARSLRFDVVAEGVETSETADLLVELG